MIRWAACSAALGVLPACLRQESEQKVGKILPEIVLPDMDGRMVSLRTYQNTCLVINFWASWCPPCRQEMPSLERLGTFFSASDLKVIGIAVDSDVNLAREFVRRTGLTFQLLWDGAHDVSDGLMHISVFPATYVVNRQHQIVQVVNGEHDWVAPSVVDELSNLLGIKKS